MYEKYNAYEMGVGGGGGEYIPQVGFGWSNAVALILLNRSHSIDTSKTSIPMAKKQFLNVPVSRGSGTETNDEFLHLTYHHIAIFAFVLVLICFMVMSSKKPIK
jgi:hypothetical protein